MFSSLDPVMAMKDAIAASASLLRRWNDVERNYRAVEPALRHGSSSFCVLDHEKKPINVIKAAEGSVPIASVALDVV